MSWPQAATLSLSILLFAAGVVLKGLSARRDNERVLIQDAAAELCSASSEVIARLKGLERRAIAGDREIVEQRDLLERALPTVAAAHARMRLAAGLSGAEVLPPTSASGWSEVLTRVTLRIGDAALADPLPLHLLADPRQDDRVGTLIDGAGLRSGGDIGDVLGEMRERFIASARLEAAGRGLGRFI